MPIANELIPIEVTTSDSFPLNFYMCFQCGLGQVENVVTPDRLFKNYRYLSSTSKSYLEHAKKFVDDLITSTNFTGNDYVLEIASNDGYLLKNFLNRGVKVLGVEPATNVASIANKSGVLTLNEFFTKTLSDKILYDYGKPKIIIANNVLAHVPDINDFMAGISNLTGKNTSISIENPSVMNLLLDNQFDTIYHEHYSYLSGYSVNKLSTKHGLKLMNIEKQPTHGGTLRYWLVKEDSDITINNSVSEQIQSELSQGLLDRNSWDEFEIQSLGTISNFATWVDSKIKDGAVICGYGAAAKASTLLNAAKIRSHQIMAIADNGAEKQGYFMPNANIPIVKPEKLNEFNPTDIIIFPWNIAIELKIEIKQILGNRVNIWKAVPHLTEIND